MGDHPKRERINSLFIKWWHTALLLGKLPFNFRCHFCLRIVCIVEERETNLLSFFFSSFLVSLHTSPPPLLFLLNLKLWKITGQKSGENQAVQTKCGAIHATSPACIKMSQQWLCISPGKRIPISLLFGSPIRRGPRNCAMDTEFGVFLTMNWDSSGAEFQPEILGHRKEKKIQDIGKNPQKVMSLFRDWLNEQVCYLQTCSTLQIYFMLLIFQGLRSIWE